MDVYQPCRRVSWLVLLSAVVLVVAVISSPRALAASARPRVGPPGLGWTRVLSDDFSRPSLNRSLWTPGWFGTGVTGPVNTAENACYDSSLARVPGDGSLHLSLVPRESTCGGSTRSYTGALVSSDPSDGVTGHRGFQYTYGYLEVRAYLPAAGPGVIANWPAIWSDGQSWPTDGENDTMEGLGGSTCFHFHSPSGGPGSCVTGDYAGWHTFASD